MLYTQCKIQHNRSLSYYRKRKKKLHFGDRKSKSWKEQDTNRGKMERESAREMEGGRSVSGHSIPEKNYYGRANKIAFQALKTFSGQQVQI